MLQVLGGHNSGARDLTKDTGLGWGGVKHGGGVKLWEGVSDYSSPLQTTFAVTRSLTRAVIYHRVCPERNQRQTGVKTDL